MEFGTAAWMHSLHLAPEQLGVKAAWMFPRLHSSSFSREDSGVSSGCAAATWSRSSSLASTPTVGRSVPQRSGAARGRSCLSAQRCLWLHSAEPHGGLGLEEEDQIAKHVQQPPAGGSVTEDAQSEVPYSFEHRLHEWFPEKRAQFPLHRVRDASRRFERGARASQDRREVVTSLLL